MNNLKKVSKTIFFSMIVFTLIATAIPLNFVNASNNITITGPSVVLEGQTAVFTVTYPDNAIYINLSSGDITLRGFQASVDVTGSGNTRKIILNNVRGIGSQRAISIQRGTAYIGDQKMNYATSNTFKIKAPIVNNQSQQNSQPKPQPKPQPQPQPKPQPEIKPQPVPNQDNNQQPKPDENINQDTNEENEENKENKKEEHDKIEENKNVNYDEVIKIPNTGKIIEEE